MTEQTGNRNRVRNRWGKINLSALWTYLLALLLIVIVLFPLAWSVSSSLKGFEEQYKSPHLLIPENPTLLNYQWLFSKLPNFPRQLMNSFIVTLTSVALTAFLATMAGYGFARIEFRGRDLLFYTVIASMFIPRSGGLMAQYELMSFLKLRNLPGIILAFSAALPVAIFIMRQTFLAIPRELEESAFIDGATTWHVFRSIALPLSTSGLIVICILKFVEVWGDYLFTLTMLDEPEHFTAAVGVAIVKSFISVDTVGSGSGANVSIAPDGVLGAANVVVMTPVVLLYIFMQKWFVRGLTEGALKM
ncbi:MAG: carbohydrate ABC transporter permease [Caldilineaceae bacterium]|nr:carbohydrate ABC transporter permease [Caldilineaceae bacterium]